MVQTQAALASPQAQVAQAQASAVQARANLNRLEEVHRLSGGKVPSETELDPGRAENQRAQAGARAANAQVAQADRKSVVQGKRVSVRVDPGGGRTIPKNTPGSQ